MQTEKPTIIFLGSLPPPFMGPTLATAVLLNSSLKEDFNIIHLDTSDHRGIAQLGKVDFLNIFLPFKHFAVLAWLIIRHRPALVYIPISQSTLPYVRDSIFILIAKILRRRVLCHLRGGYFKKWLASVSGVTRFYVKKVHGMVDGQIVLGEILRNLFADILPDERVFVVPNGKNIEVAEPARKGGDPEKLNVLFLANIIPGKGVMETLYAIPTVCKEFANVEFTFAGSWCDDDLRQDVAKFLSENEDLPIHWKGTLVQDEKRQALRRADLFVFPTYYVFEGHPWVIIEAMANGLPVISTDHAAIRETVIDGRNGFLVKKKSSKSIAAGVLTLLRDEKLRKAFGQESRKLYENRFTEEKMVKAFATAVEGVLAVTPKKKKVLLLGPLPPPFMGPTLATSILLNSKLTERFDIRHFDTSDHRDLTTLGVLDITNVFLALKHYIKLFVVIGWTWPNLVYVPVSQSTLPYLKDSGFVLISRLLGRRVVAHLRGGGFKNWISQTSWLTRRYVKLIQGLVNSQVILGENLRTMFDGFVPSDRIHVVPNGKDIAKPKPRRQRKTVRVLYLSNFIRSKGAMDLLQAVPLVTAECDNVEFHLYGEWVEAAFRTEVENYLRKHPSLPVMLGGSTYEKEKYDRLSDADIFVFVPRSTEGHPWVLVEAMACGLPIIATDQGTTTESVIDSVNGVIIPHSSPKDLARKLVELVKHPGTRTGMGQQSRALYERSFTEDAMVGRMSKCFSQTIGGD